MDLRGNLVFYEIVYYGLSEEQCPAKTYGSTGNTNISVTGEDPYAVIANLESAYSGPYLAFYIWGGGEN